MDNRQRGWSFGVIALGAITLAGWITIAQIGKLDDAARSVRHSEEVSLALERSLSSLKDAETGTRGFTVTRDEVLLAPYFDAMERLDAELDRLNTLLAGSPDQATRARELKELMEARLGPLRNAVEAARPSRRWTRWPACSSKATAA